VQIVGDERRQREGFTLTLVAEVNDALRTELLPIGEIVESMQTRRSKEHPATYKAVANSTVTTEITHVVNAAQLMTRADHGSST
jgi:ATP:corrinoid adenosyltransferase